MNTANLNLEKINLDDTINGTMLEKTNNNMQKIDDKYGELKDALLKQTGKNTLTEAITYIQTLADNIAFLNSSGNASSSQILAGKEAVVKGTVITGTIPSRGAQTIIPGTSNKTISSCYYLSGTQTIQGDANLIASNIISGKSIFGVAGNAKKQTIINVTLDSSANSTYAGYISGYGAGIDHNGTLVIWAMSSTTSYEHINFVNTSIGIGTIGNGWNITSHDTADSVNTPHACTITGLSAYDTINVILKPTAVNSSYDYVTIQVTVTGS